MQRAPRERRLQTRLPRFDRRGFGRQVPTSPISWPSAWGRRAVRRRKSERPRIATLIQGLACSSAVDAYREIAYALATAGIRQVVEYMREHGCGPLARSQQLAGVGSRNGVNRTPMLVGSISLTGRTVEEHVHRVEVENLKVIESQDRIEPPMDVAVFHFKIVLPHMGKTQETRAGPAHAAVGCSARARGCGRNARMGPGSCSDRRLLPVCCRDSSPVGSLEECRARTDRGSREGRQWPTIHA